MKPFLSIGLFFFSLLAFGVDVPEKIDWNMEGVKIKLRYEAEPEDGGSAYLTISVNGKLLHNPDAPEDAQFDCYSCDASCDLLMAGGKRYIALRVRMVVGIPAEDEWTYVILPHSGRVLKRFSTYSFSKGSAMEALYIHGILRGTKEGLAFYEYSEVWPAGEASWMGPMALGKTIYIPRPDRGLERKSRDRYVIIPEIDHLVLVPTPGYRKKPDRKFKPVLMECLKVAKEHGGIYSYINEIDPHEIAEDYQKYTRIPLEKTLKAIKKYLINQ